MTQAVILSQEQKAQNWSRENPWYVGLFYFFQGFYMVGVFIYVLTMMADWGVPAPTQASVVAFLGLPLYLKMFPSLLSDRVPIGRWGRRKPYIFIGGLLYIPGFALLIAIREFGTAWLGAILLILVAWMFVDSMLDALTVDITPNEKVSQMQSSAWGGRQFGYALGGLLTPILGPRLGWTPMLVTIGAGAIMQSGTAFLLGETPISRETLQQEMPVREVFRSTFGRPQVWLAIFFILLFSARGIDRIFNIYLLTELGWNNSPDTMRTYGILTAVSTLVSALGALLVGRLPSKWLTSFKFYAVFLLVIWVLATPWLLVNRFPENIPLIYGAQILSGFSAGVHMTLMLALTMRICPKSIEGFTFALLTSVRSLALNAIGPKTATAFSAQLGLLPSIFTLIPYALVSLVFLYPLLNQMKQGNGAIREKHLLASQ